MSRRSQIRTDWSERRGAAHANLQQDGAHTPGSATEADQLLVSRGIIGFGVETIGTDAGQAHLMAPMYSAHTVLHGGGRFGRQCLTNLDQFSPAGALVIAPPLKIQGGAGSPLRILAMVPDQARKPVLTDKGPKDFTNPARM